MEESGTVQDAPSHYTIFYLVDDSSQTVTVIRIIYSGRSLKNVLTTKKDAASFYATPFLLLQCF